MKRERNTYYDFLKGLAIMGVVAIHTMILRYEPYTIGGLMLAVFRNLLGCCVPFFVAASGYFLANKVIKSKNDYCNFIKSRIRTIYIPMLIWAFPWLCLKIISAHSLLKLGYSLILYFIGGLSILYFISLIVELYLQLPVIQRVNRGGVIALSIISIVVTCAWSIINYATEMNPPLVLYCSFPTYIGYFALGCYIRRHEVSPSLWFSSIIIIIGLILSVLESYFWLDYNPQNNWLGLKSSVQFLSFGIILLLFSKKISGFYKTNKMTRIIEVLGTQSMPIYMSHMLVKFAMSAIGFNPNFWIIHWGVVFALDVFFILTLNKILPNKFLQYIGIR